MGSDQTCLWQGQQVDNKGVLSSMDHYRAPCPTLLLLQFAVRWSKYIFCHGGTCL
uniref:Uncharacterized protein n=1 Tax=Triticum urartu TaxID=4572 RepID=A0A8R7NXM4_TRIUA